MAKKKTNSILDSSTEELKNIGKSIMKQAEAKKQPPKPKSTPTEKSRDKALYVSVDKHQQARIQAAKRNMKIKEYITFLIDEDEKHL